MPHFLALAALCFCSLAAGMEPCIGPHFIKHGYDSVRGDPAWGLGDPVLAGWKSEVVVDATAGVPAHFNNATCEIPLGSVFQPLPASRCSLTPTTTLVTNADEWKNALSSIALVDACGDGDAACELSAMRAKVFSAAASVQARLNDGDERVIFVSIVRCDVLELSWQAEPSPSNPLLQAARNMATVQPMHLVQAFGTHYVESVRFGGVAVFVVDMAATSYQRLRARWHNVVTLVEADFHSVIRDGNTDGRFALPGWSEYTTSVTNRVSVVLGPPPPRQASAWQWHMDAQLADNLVPTSAVFRPLLSLLSSTDDLRADVDVAHAVRNIGLFLRTTYCPQGCERHEGVWPSVDHDSQHTCMSAYAGPIASNGLRMGRLWVSPALPGSIVAGLIVTSSNLIAVTNAGVVTALDDSTGSIRWETELHDPVAVSPVASFTGLLYVVSDSGSLIILQHETGDIKRRVVLGITPTSHPVMASDGSLVFSTSDSVLLFDVETLSVRWQHAIPGGVSACCALHSDGSVFVGTVAGNVVSLRASGVTWTVQVSADSVTSISVHITSYTLFAVSDGGTLSALQTSTGAQRWGLNGLLSPPSINTRAGLISYYDSTGLAFVHTHNGTVAAQHDTSDVGYLGQPTVTSNRDAVCVAADGSVASVSLSGQVWSAPPEAANPLTGRVVVGTKGLLYGMCGPHVCAIGLVA